MPLRHLPRTVLTRRREGDEPVMAQQRAPGDHWGRTMAALSGERIELFLQPVALLAGHSCVGFDTMVRIGSGHDGGVAAPSPAPSHPRSLVSDEAADDPAGVAALHAWLIEAAGRALARWQPDLRPGDDRPFVSVSVDSRYLADERFLTSVKDAVRAAGIEPCDLMLSVDAGPELASRWSKLQRLKSHGVMVALEGFSLEPAATELLRRFSFDAVRLTTPSLLVLDDDDSELRATIKLAHNLGCRALIDGVDERRQADKATWLGADMALGEALGSPRPVSGALYASATELRARAELS